jgi:hypothetical protein
MPMMRPNTGTIKPGDAGRYFFPNIWVRFLFPCRENTAEFLECKLICQGTVCSLAQRKIPKGKFCSDQDLLSLQDYW